MATPVALPRVLMLPGYTQNAHILRGKMGSLRKALKDSAELVFVDPPHVVDVTIGSTKDFDSTANESATTPEETPRAWWFADHADNFTTYRGADEALRHLRRILEEQGPFDGVFGFSQGAACAAILTALVEDPSRHPIFAAPSSSPSSASNKWPPAPFKFAVLSAGFLPLDPTFKALFSSDAKANANGGKVKIPSLHVLGRGDTIVGAERSVPLSEGFEDARVEWHDGGHHTPSKLSWRTFFKAYFDLFLPGGLGSAGIQDVKSPSGAVSAPDLQLDEMASGGKL